MKRFPQKCPFCPPQSKRLFNDEIGLFQHGIAISKFNPNPEVIRAHTPILIAVRDGLNVEALRKSYFLHLSANYESGLQKHSLSFQEMCNSQSKSTQDTCESNQSTEVKVVWPWMGILMNIDYERLATNGKNSGKDHDGHAKSANNLWNFDLKGHFSCFNPRVVHALRNQHLAVLDFGNDLLGCFDAEDFARGFAQCARGKRDFLNMESSRKNHVQGMFGWIADEEDYNRNNAVGEFLRKRGSLRIMPQFSHTWGGQYDQLFQDMRSNLQDRNLKLIEIKKEVCNLQTLVCQAENEKQSAESQFTLKELKHKQELETIRRNTEKALQNSKGELLKEKVRLSSLQDELTDLKKKCQLLEEKNSKPVYDEEKSFQHTSDETLLQQLIDAVEEKEGLECTVNNLIYKEREANDKVQSALKAATEVLEVHNEKSIIGVKDMGSLNREPWLKACAVKFKDEEEGWETACLTLVSTWEKHLRNSSWQPYKSVMDQGEKIEEVIDTKDKMLTKLRQDFGAEVYNSVVDALNELQEYNSSGRYPVKVPWNFERGRPAELDEIIRYLGTDGVKRKRASTFRSLGRL